MKAGLIHIARRIYADRTCGYCGWLTYYVNWWCSNREAVRARRTSIPGCCHCPYWKPDKPYIKQQIREMSK